MIHLKKVLRYSIYKIIPLLLTVLFILAACKNPSSGGGTPSGDDPIPVAGDFVTGNFIQELDSFTPVTVTPKPDKSTGAITVYYNGSPALPTAAGYYAVTFNVAATTGWKAAAGLYAGMLKVNNKIVGTVAELGTYLSGQIGNGVDSPYRVALNANDLANIVDTLIANDTRYVILDLSDSGITSIPDWAFFMKTRLVCLV